MHATCGSVALRLNHIVLINPYNKILSAFFAFTK